MSKAATSQHFFVYLSCCIAVCAALLCGYANRWRLGFRNWSVTCASLSSIQNRTKSFLNMSDSVQNLKQSKMKTITLYFSFQVRDGGSCVHTFAWASFAHMRSDSPTTELEQQSNFWWVSTATKISTRPVVASMTTARSVHNFSSSVRKMRWHCPPNTRSFQSVNPWIPKNQWVASQTPANVNWEKQVSSNQERSASPQQKENRWPQIKYFESIYLAPFHRAQLVEDKVVSWNLHDNKVRKFVALLHTWFLSHILLSGKMW